MSVNRDRKRGTWMVQVRYRDMFGVWHKTTKRGFKTKSEAKAWEASFRARMDGMLDMVFSQFYEVYAEDMRPRLKESTWVTKEHMIRTKILPFFADMKMRDIRPADVVRWENWLLGLDLSPTYVRTIVNQLSAIMNHAVRFYRLPANPVLAAGKVGSKRPEQEMKFWTPRSTACSRRRSRTSPTCTTPTTSCIIADSASESCWHSRPRVSISTARSSSCAAPISASRARTPSRRPRPSTPSATS